MLGWSLTWRSACFHGGLGNDREKETGRRESQISPEASIAEEGFSLLLKDKSNRVGWEGRREWGGGATRAGRGGVGMCFCTKTKELS